MSRDHIYHPIGYHKVGKTIEPKGAKITVFLLYAILHTIGREQEENCHGNISETAYHVLYGVLILLGEMNKDHDESGQSLECRGIVFRQKELALGVTFSPPYKYNGNNEY